MTAPAHVLIVDDDLVVGETFARMLKVNGFQVSVVQSVDAALEAAGRQVPDAILSDLRMPMVDGLGLLTRVRRDPRLREVPIAIVTGDHFLTEEFLGELRAYGASVRFKPLFMSDLLELVNGLTSGSGAPA
ncbi:MAG: response regulator [Acidobacteria bacterium]|nr:response regulator [Acidobacteriota bacterium]MBP8274364.1 response regulator [Acidobacteriota bacterium]